MASPGPFNSSGSATITYTTGNLSSSLSAALAGSGDTAVITNNSGAAVAVAFGTAGVAASVNSPVIVLNGQRAIVACGVATNVAAIPIGGAAVNNGAVYVMRGAGGTF